MEVFSIFATLSLKDLLSGALANIRQGLGKLETDVASLGSRMGNFALSMAPLALGAGAVLGAFGKCVATAAGFEDQMAKVGAVSRASGEELKALEARARELGATTQFTASEVAQAEQYLAMAGFGVQENIATLPGVLNLAAATATDLGRAADISSDIMSAFGIKAAEMGHVADVLTATCNSANTNMEMLGDTMKYVGPVARTAGLSLEEAATMAGILANSGIKASQGGTVLRSMLNRLAAPTGEAAKTLQKLGVTTQDAAGNLKKPITIMKEMAASMQGMGNAAQMAALKTIFGDEAMAGVSVLLKNVDGDWNKLFDTLSNVDGVAQKTAEAMNDTLAGDVRSLGSAFESVQITIGNIFIPVLRKIVAAITAVIRAIDKFSQSKAGQVILKLVAALSAGLVAITAFSGAMWGISRLAPMLSSVFGGIRAAMLGLGAPVWALIAVLGVLYLAWTNDFGGMAGTISRWGKNIKLIFDGVCAVFASLQGTSGEIRGELAKEIKANGLVGLVTTVGKIVFRIRSMFQGFWNTLQQSFHRASALLIPVRMAVADLLNSLKSLFSSFAGGEVNSAVSTWEKFGETLGMIAGGLLEGAASSLSWLVEGIRFMAVILGHVIGFVSSLCSSLFSLTGAASAANDAANPASWGALGRMLGVVLATVVGVKAAFLVWKGVMLAVSVVTKAFAAAQWLLNAAMSANPIGIVIALCVALAAAAGWVIANWDSIKAWWSELWSGVSASLSSAWDSILAFLGRLNPVPLISNAFSGLSEFFASLNFVDGIQQAWNRVLEFLAGLNLFESGARLIETLKEGVLSAASGLIEGVKGVFSGIRNLLPFSDAKEGPLSELTLSGSRLMTTLAEGVSQGSDSLKQSVAGALGEVNADLQGFQGALGPLALDRAQADLPQAVVAPLTLNPEMAALPKLPRLGLAVDGVAASQPLQVPQPQAPHVAIPNPPMTFQEDNAGSCETRAGGQQAQSITIHIGSLNLPDVDDPEKFASKLMSVIQGQISQLEGSPA